MGRKMGGSLAKLYQAPGYKNSIANVEDNETIFKKRHDKDGAASHTVLNPCKLPPDDPLNATHKSYDSWLKDHPSALGCFEGMLSEAKGKRIVVFLDYDGTLSPIVNDPECAFMSDQMRSAVCEVAKRYPTAIISGRSLEKVREFVKLNEVYYAGSHGMDIRGPPQQVKTYDGKNQTKALDKEDEFIIFQPAQKFLPDIKEILKELEKETRGIQGVMIEDNRFCVSVHYRQVQKSDNRLLRQIVQSILGKYPHFHPTEGKMVMEIRPSIEWNKGHALEYLLKTLGFTGMDNVLPVYIGDDRTDEDAFKVLKSKGLGYPIIVSSTPRDTMATHSLRDPSEVLSFLTRLASMDW